MPRGFDSDGSEPDDPAFAADFDGWGLDNTCPGQHPHRRGRRRASIEGTLGYSECTEGNESGPCPFYLGSMELELTEPLELTLTCDNEPEEHELEELTLRLAQPAFGIAEEDTNWRAFPPGSLVFEAEGVLDGVPFTSTRPNEEPLYVEAAGGWIEVESIFGAWVETTLPCGEDDADILLGWSFESSTPALGSPPSVEITIADQVWCQGPAVSLTANVSDPDSDVASVRWYADGVLLSSSTSAMTFHNGSHTMSVVVTDSRGAATTDTKQVGCIPL